MTGYSIVEQIGGEAFQIGEAHETRDAAALRLADLTACRDQEVDAFVDGPDYDQDDDEL